jgi:hypothetical protein
MAIEGHKCGQTEEKIASRNARQKWINSSGKLENKWRG